VPILMVPAAALRHPSRGRPASRVVAGLVAVLLALLALLGAVTDDAAAQEPVTSESTEGTRPTPPAAPLRGDVALEVHVLAPADVPDASWRRTRIERDEGPPVSPLSQRSPRPRRGPPAA
jgi:hypothetical protein